MNYDKLPVIEYSDDTPILFREVFKSNFSMEKGGVTVREAIWISVISICLSYAMFPFVFNALKLSKNNF